jgi:hypothetical protein
MSDGEIKVTVRGRKRVLMLHHWYEPLEPLGGDTVAMVMRCEMLTAGKFYAFETFALINRDERWKIDHIERARMFLERLRDHHSRSRGPLPMGEFMLNYYGADLPFVEDLRDDDGQRYDIPADE